MSENLIPAQNYTQIPNIIFDYWMQVLTHAEFKVLLCICRKTFGWHKKSDGISLNQIEKLTGVNRRGIQDHIKKLVDHGLVEVFRQKTDSGDDAPNQYQIIVKEQVTKVIVTPPPGNSNTSNEIKEIFVEKSLPYGRVTITPTKETSTKEKKDIYKPSFLSFGKHVKMSEEDYQKLCDIHSKEKIHKIFEEMNDYIDSTGRKYKCFAATARTFLRNSRDKNIIPAELKKTTEQQEYEDELLEQAKVARKFHEEKRKQEKLNE